MKRRKWLAIIATVLCFFWLAQLSVPAVAPALGSRTLREGMRGEDVKELQQKLASLGYKTGGADGYYGPVTEKAVTAFQKDHKVPATGVFAKLTLAALTSAWQKKTAAAAPLAAEVTQSGFYRVNRGDTLQKIASRFGLTVAQLCEMNGITNPNLIYSGRLLLVKPTGTAPATTEPAKPPAAAEPPPEPAAPAAPAVVYDKRIAFTFDDGPHPVYTAQIAAALEKYGGKGTFFVTGEAAEANGAVLGALAQSGHEIGNHTYSHKNLAGRAGAAYRQEVEKAAEVILRLTGKKSLYFRPPEGEISAALGDVLARTGHTLVLWSNLGARDWLLPDKDSITRGVLRNAYDGAIIMLHDTNALTAEALPAILAKLDAEGYRFVTVSALAGGSTPPVSAP